MENSRFQCTPGRWRSAKAPCGTYKHPESPKSGDAHAVQGRWRIQPKPPEPSGSTGVLRVTQGRAPFTNSFSHTTENALQSDQSKTIPGWMFGESKGRRLSLVY